MMHRAAILLLTFLSACASAQTFIERGDAARAAGDLGRARVEYDRAIATDDACTEAYVQRGALRRDLGDVDGALEDFERAIRLRINSHGRWIEIDW